MCLSITTSFFLGTLELLLRKVIWNAPSKRSIRAVPIYKINDRIYKVKIIFYVPIEMSNGRKIYSFKEESFFELKNILQT